MSWSTQTQMIGNPKSDGPAQLYDLCILDGLLPLAFDTEQSWAMFRKVLPSRIYDYGARMVGNIGMTRASLLTCYCLLEGLRQVCLIIVW